MPKDRAEWKRAALRLILVVGLILATPMLAALYFVSMPGSSHSGPLPALSSDQRAIAAEVEEHVRKLANEIGARSTRRPETLSQAADYLMQELRACGLEPSLQTYRAGSADVSNVIARIVGSTHPEELVVVGGHYDSVPDSLGADDNASGTAAMLAIAKRLAVMKPARSVGLAAPTFVNGVDFSDHRSYWDQGYRALMVTDTALFRNPHYHMASDHADNVDYEALARVTEGMLHVVLAAADPEQLAH